MQSRNSGSQGPGTGPDPIKSNRTGQKKAAASLLPAAGRFLNQPSRAPQPPPPLTATPSSSASTGPAQRNQPWPAAHRSSLQTRTHRPPILVHRRKRKRSEAPPQNSSRCNLGNGVYVFWKRFRRLPHRAHQLARCLLRNCTWILANERSASFSSGLGTVAVMAPPVRYCIPGKSAVSRANPGRDRGKKARQPTASADPWLMHRFLCRRTFV